MDCPSEEGLIRRRLHGMDGILDLRFNLMGRSLDVVHDLRSVQPITEALHGIGMKAVAGWRSLRADRGSLVWQNFRRSRGIAAW